MSFNNQYLIRNTNKPNRYGGKENNHSLSPNVRPIHSVNRPIQNALFPKNQIMFNNNHNYNIKINKIPRQKEKIIEGDLNFNNTSKQIYMKGTHKNNYLNNKAKNRGMPRKSPLPITGTFRSKDILSFNRIFNSSNYRYIKPEPKKFNKTNMFKATGNNKFMNNYIFGGNLNSNMSKSFNSLNKKKDRSHTPILRAGENKAITLGAKINKNRYVSKSPNLGKGSIFNKYGKNFTISLLNKNIVKKRIVKKSPNNSNNNIINKNNNNNNINKINNINNFNNINNINNNKKVNNVNIPSQKRNTIISGDLYQEPLKPNKINYAHNNDINKGTSNMPNVNIRPISNNNKLSVSSNNNHPNTNINQFYNNYGINSMNPLRNKSNENILNNNLVFPNNSNSNSNSNIKNNSKKPINPHNDSDNENNKANKENKNIINNNIIIVNKPENNNIDNTNLKEEINNKPINGIQQLENNNNSKNNDILRSNPPHVTKAPNTIVTKSEEKNMPIENQEINPLKKQEELKEGKKNVRSLSQTPVNPLNKNSNSDRKEEIQKIEKKPKKIVVDDKVFKKIKDILPYTHVGFDGEEPKENNQDNYFIFKNFAEKKDYIYFSVCDGHGVEGHFVSEFIKEVLPYYMSENLKNRDILSDENKEMIHQIISDTFIMVNNMLVSNEEINSLFSGSTCVSVIYTPQRLIVPNIGDSRAVLGRFDKNTGKYKAIELSRDHKPTEKDEAKRIYENNGRIQPFTEDGEFVGPQRVWIKEEEVPGLAMTRSFGDRVAATVGVMSEPEIKEFDFDENDKYMIIASDGIWEFISSQECIDIIQKYYENNDLKGCCEYLYQESSKRWLKEEEVIDDTTLILVFFE